jgi:hypothetical protein
MARLDQTYMSRAQVSVQEAVLVRPSAWPFDQGCDAWPLHCQAVIGNTMSRPPAYNWSAFQEVCTMRIA